MIFLTLIVFLYFYSTLLYKGHALNAIEPFLACLSPHKILSYLSLYYSSSWTEQVFN